LVAIRIVGDVLAETVQWHNVMQSASPDYRDEARMLPVDPNRSCRLPSTASRSLEHEILLILHEMHRQGICLVQEETPSSMFRQSNRRRAPQPHVRRVTPVGQSLDPIQDNIPTGDSLLRRRGNRLFPRNRSNPFDPVLNDRVQVFGIELGKSASTRTVTAFTSRRLSGRRMSHSCTASPTSHCFLIEP